ncbi:MULTISPECIES: hypothetical protein [unclassified Streptomyces]|uniref:hypothetical protein n=1 Tax=unclassified Streptomyces TaxID=2593676 RepID=UPI00131B05E3|nr:hypothetical protein [Streptomyces sp. CB01201]
MAATERITVTLPADILAAIRTEADGNVSAYTAKALQTQAVRDAADRLSAWQRSRAAESDDLQELALDSLDAAAGGGR